ncbi:hypothetical protein E1J61_00890 [Cupriavidus sp. L7L]|nr:hypothetical protein E1J61_00890 [Cupriavidus sp. L7L]
MFLPSPARGRGVGGAGRCINGRYRKISRLPALSPGPSPASGRGEQTLREANPSAQSSAPAAANRPMARRAAARRPVAAGRTGP